MDVCGMEAQVHEENRWKHEENMQTPHNCKTDMLSAIQQFCIISK